MVNMVSKKLLLKAKSLQPTIRIGKSGITESQIKEIKKQLKARKIIKIKLLKQFIESNNKKQAIEQIAKKTNSEIIQIVGFTCVIHKD